MSTASPEGSSGPSIIADDLNKAAPIVVTDGAESVSEVSTTAQTTQGIIKDENRTHSVHDTTPDAGLTGRAGDITSPNLDKVAQYLEDLARFMELVKPYISVLQLKSPQHVSLMKWLEEARIMGKFSQDNYDNISELADESTKKITSLSAEKIDEMSTRAEEFREELIAAETSMKKQLDQISEIKATLDEMVKRNSEYMKQYLLMLKETQYQGNKVPGTPSLPMNSRQGTILSDANLGQLADLMAPKELCSLAASFNFTQEFKIIEYDNHKNCKRQGFELLTGLCDKMFETAASAADQTNDAIATVVAEKLLPALRETKHFDANRKLKEMMKNRPN